MSPHVTITLSPRSPAARLPPEAREGWTCYEVGKPPPEARCDLCNNPLRTTAVQLDHPEIVEPLVVGPDCARRLAGDVATWWRDVGRGLAGHKRKVEFSNKRQAMLAREAELEAREAVEREKTRKRRARLRRRVREARKRRREIVLYAGI